MKTACVLTCAALAMCIGGPQPAHGDLEEAGFGRYADHTAQWEQVGGDLLDGFGNMYNLHVIEEPAAPYSFKGWFFGWAVEDCNPGYPGCDAIYAARAKALAGPWEVYCGEQDGIPQWSAAGDAALWAPVIAGGPAYYNNWHNGDPSVVKREGRYYMAYSATGHNKDGIPFGQEGDTDSDISCVMGAVSEDGLHWTKTDQPLLIESEAARQAACTSEHICDFHRPALMREDDKWKLWFDYWNHPHGVCLGYAENADAFDAPDGFKVQHDLRQEPLIKNWPNPDVVRIDGRYHAFADPIGYPPTSAHSDSARSWSSRALCEAVSDDGMHWRIVGYIRPDADTPACHVPQALLTSINSERRLYLFYSTQRGGEPVYDYRYDRIRTMYRRQ